MELIMSGLIINLHGGFIRDVPAKVAGVEHDYRNSRPAGRAAERERHVKGNQTPVTSHGRTNISVLLKT